MTFEGCKFKLKCDIAKGERGTNGGSELSITMTSFWKNSLEMSPEVYTHVM